MFRKLHLIAIAVALFFFLAPQVTTYANEETSESMVENEEIMEGDKLMMEDEEKADGMMEESETVTEVDSFELFWPIVAGKTRGDSLYFLKKLKENVRGWLIFGDAKDAEYEVFLATKRVVEAEALIKNDEHELARETIEDARENVADALDEWEDVEDKDTAIKHELNNKLANLEKFLPYLSTQTDNSDLQSEINELFASVQKLDEQI